MNTLHTYTLYSGEEIFLAARHYPNSEFAKAILRRYYIEDLDWCFVTPSFKLDKKYWIDSYTTYNCETTYRLHRETKFHKGRTEEIDLTR